jgi:hypothetical protein
VCQDVVVWDIEVVLLPDKLRYASPLAKSGHHGFRAALHSL